MFETLLGLLPQNWLQQLVSGAVVGGACYYFGRRKLRAGFRSLLFVIEWYDENKGSIKAFVQREVEKYGTMGTIEKELGKLGLKQASEELKRKILVGGSGVYSHYGLTPPSEEEPLTEGRAYEKLKKRYIASLVLKGVR